MTCGADGQAFQGMSVFLADGMPKVLGCQGTTGQPRVEIFTWSHLKKRDPAKRVGNPMSKWLWDITLRMEAEVGSGMADQKRDTLPT